MTVRLSVTDWLDGGGTLEESIELIRRLKSAGLDMIDVSHGMIVPDRTKAPSEPGFMIPYAAQIRRDVEIATTASWLISEPKQAETAIQNSQLDMVTLGRERLRDPYGPYHAAEELGVALGSDILPIQYTRAV